MFSFHVAAPYTYHSISIGESPEIICLHPLACSQTYYNVFIINYDTCMTYPRVHAMYNFKLISVTSARHRFYTKDRFSCFFVMVSFQLYRSYIFSLRAKYR